MLQFDDSDAMVWVVIYGLGAGLCFLAALGFRVAMLVTVALITCFAWSGWLAPHVVTWLTNHPPEFIVDEASVELAYMEKSRECLGLLIAAVGLTFAWLSARRRSVD